METLLTRHSWATRETTRLTTFDAPCEYVTKLENHSNCPKRNSALERRLLWRTTSGGVVMTNWWWYDIWWSLMERRKRKLSLLERKLKAKVWRKSDERTTMAVFPPFGNPNLSSLILVSVLVYPVAVQYRYVCLYDFSVRTVRSLVWTNHLQMNKRIFCVSVFLETMTSMSGQRDLREYSVWSVRVWAHQIDTHQVGPRDVNPWPVCVPIPFPAGNSHHLIRYVQWRSLLVRRRVRFVSWFGMSPG